MTRAHSIPFLRAATVSVAAFGLLLMLGGCPVVEEAVDDYVTKVVDDQISGRTTPGPAGPQGEQGPAGPQGETGPAGPQGPAGTNGTNGANGKDGQAGVNGTNGTNGVDGLNGIDGINGKDGLNGLDGAPGVVPTGSYALLTTEVAPDGFTYTGAWMRLGEGWTAKAAVPAARAHAGAATLDGKVYVVGGLMMQPDVPVLADGEVQVTTAQCDMYDPATNSWSTIAALNEARSGHAVVALDGVLYAIGGDGVDGTHLASVEQYDPAADQWVNVAALDSPRSSCGAAVLDGKIYVVGGLVGANRTETSSMRIYDPATDSWSEGVSLSRQRSRLAAVAFDGRIFAIGGYKRSVLGISLPTETVDMFDPTVAQWQAGVSLPAARESLSAVVMDGHLFALGGTDGLNGPSSAVYEFDPAARTWLTRAPMLTALSKHMAAAIDGGIVTLGGWQQLYGVSSMTPQTQVYTPATLFYLHIKN